MTEDPNKIYQLVPDIYSLLSRAKGTHKVDRENLQRYLDLTMETILKYLEEPKEEGRGNNLRLSSIGTPPRKMWFEQNSPGYEKEGNSGPTVLKFMVGSLMEALILFLCQEAGHEVSRQQENLELEGVPGHPDALIDGKLTDVKTCSEFTFSKFSEAKLLTDPEADTFGYIPQIAAYHEAMGLPKDSLPLFLAFQKSSCELCLLEVPANYLPDPRELIKQAREVVKMPSPPEQLCYAERPDGKSGNMKIGGGCTFCPFKFQCFPDLRAFSYSNGTRFLSQVVKTPDVEEITDRLKAYSKV